MKDEKKTKEAIDAQGWLHSGDGTGLTRTHAAASPPPCLPLTRLSSTPTAAVGAIDEDGMLRITGRLKELIIGSGGENIAPVPIEDKIKALCPGLSNAMMIGDKRKYNVVLFTVKTTLNPETGTPAGGSNLPRTFLEPSSNFSCKPLP